jgi:hypothetical protein
LCLAIKNERGYNNECKCLLVQPETLKRAPAKQRWRGILMKISCKSSAEGFNGYYKTSVSVAVVRSLVTYGFNGEVVVFNDVVS